MRKLLKLLFFMTLLPIMSYSDDKSTVYIYDDTGASAESLMHTKATFRALLNTNHEIKSIDAQGVKDGKWTQDAAIFIMPGGADLPYVDKLNGKGNQMIKQYVEQGGTYVGICAGAYYASGYVEFDKGGPLQVLGERELQFFKGKAIGPILAKYDYRNQSGSRAATIKTNYINIDTVTVFYNGGGYFENAQKFDDTTVIATYHNGLPAIISVKYGEGTALLSGVHFEYDDTLLDAEDEFLQNIIPSLEADKGTRIQLIKQLLNDYISVPMSLTI